MQWLRWRGLVVASCARESGLLDASRLLLLLLLLLLQYVQCQLLAGCGRYTST